MALEMEFNILRLIATSSVTSLLVLLKEPRMASRRRVKVFLEEVSLLEIKSLITGEPSGE
jgi:hypothetical protein